LVSSGPSAAAVLSAPEIMPVETVMQRFLTEGASLVSKGDVHSCRAFRAIDVRASQYFSPDGSQDAFTDVKRSPAAGLWRIGSATQMLTSAQLPNYSILQDRVWRIVLKYPVQSLEMEIGDVRTNLTGSLDAAGDSVTLSQQDLEQMQSAWQIARDVTLIGHSVDTGRRVIDTLLPILDRDLSACDGVEQGQSPEVLSSFVNAPVQLRAPDSLMPLLPIEDASLGFQYFGVMGMTAALSPARHHLGNNGDIRVLWGEQLEGTVDKDRLTGCRMTDLGGEIELYKLIQVNGFVSQSSEAWITRDEAGEVRQVYIPGVFEALRQTATEDWTADVSVAAFANNVFEEPVYKGCLGTQSIPMTAGVDTLSERPPGESAQTVYAVSAASAPSGFSNTLVNTGIAPGLFFDGGERESPSGLLISEGFDVVPGPNDPEDVIVSSSGGVGDILPTPVPLPAGVWLYLAALGSFGWVTLRRLPSV